MSNMVKVGEALLKAKFPNSRFYVTDDDKTWKDTHDWVIVERDMNLIVWFDRGYGLIALTDGKTVETGCYSIVTPNIVVLDKDYYGATKYIWR